MRDGMRDRRNNLAQQNSFRALEKRVRRPLTRQKPGPKKHSAAVTGQAILSFDSF
jgi:hypothetical protein